MNDIILKLVDRVVLSYLSYRQGKISVINEMQAKLIEDIERVKAIHNDNTDLTVQQLLDKLYS